VGVEGHLLALRVGDDIVSVRAPVSWVVGNDTKRFLELFVDNVIDKGDAVSLEVIKVTLTSPDRPAVSFYIASKINDTTKETTAQALLPFELE